MTSDNMTSDNMTSVGISSESTSSDNTIDINCQITWYRKTIPIWEIGTNTEKYAAFGKQYK